MRLLLVSCLSLIVMSCDSYRDSLISVTNVELQGLSLGMSKSQALPTIQKLQREFLALSGQYYKSPEQFMKDGKRVHIFYVMTSRIPDGDITPDEFTPIVFEDDSLVAIGWTALGGVPKVFRADVKVRN